MRFVAFDGNSQTYGGFQTTPDKYPSLCLALLPGYTGTNFGVGAQNILHMIADAATEIDTVWNLENTKNICVPWEGINDIYTNGATAAEAYAHYVSYCNSRRARGWKIVAVTCIPDTRIPYATITEYNELLRDNWATFADALADVEADARLQGDGAELNLTYRTIDAVHLTTAGNAVIAEVVAAAINGL